MTICMQTIEIAAWIAAAVEPQDIRTNFQPAEQQDIVR